MNGESELVARIQAVVATFGRKAERERRRREGKVGHCRGCAAEVVTHGVGRKRVWCDACRGPGGPMHQEKLADNRRRYHESKQREKGEK